MPFPLHNREGVFRQVLSKYGGKIIISAESVDDEVDYGRKMRRKVKLAGTMLFSFESRSERSSHFSIVQFIDAGGFIPAKVVNLKLPKSLSVAEELRVRFARDDEIDEIQRGEMAALMGWNESVSEDEEVRWASSATG